jgi:hypothetical protein
MSTDAMNAEEAVLNMLHRYEVLAMEDLILGRPDFSWAQLFFAIDRLSRANVIAISRFGLGYQLRLLPHADRLGRPQRQKEPAVGRLLEAVPYRTDVPV